MDATAAVVPAPGKNKTKPRANHHQGLTRQPFRRLVRELLFELRPSATPMAVLSPLTFWVSLPRHAVATVRVKGKTLLALQEATEAHVMRIFEQASKCSVHAKRITVQAGDVALALSILES